MNYIYIEDQFFWLSLSSQLGLEIAESLASAIRRGVSVLVVVSNPLANRSSKRTYNMPLRYNGLRYLSAIAAQSPAHGSFTVVSPRSRTEVASTVPGEFLEVHSKVVAIDDMWLLVGSANFNNRSWGLDREASVAILDSVFVANAVRSLWAHMIDSENLEDCPSSMPDLAHLLHSFNARRCARRYVLMRRCFGGAAAIPLLMAGCTPAPEAAPTAESTTSNSVSTTEAASFGVDLCDDDSTAEPGRNTPSDFEQGRGRVAEFEGLEVEAAVEAAEANGFEEVRIIACDGSDSNGPTAFGYTSVVIGLYQQDEIVLRAWVGG